MGEYQHISTEESFGNIENIVPAPKLLNLEGQSIDIDKLLGVQNVTVTTTTIRKSHIPETAPIQIDSTQVTQEAIPTQTYNDSLPTITPAEPLETIAPVESLPTITPTESLPIITPAEPLPETTINRIERIFQKKEIYKTKTHKIEPKRKIMMKMPINNKKKIVNNKNKIKSQNIYNKINLTFDIKNPSPKEQKLREINKALKEIEKKSKELNKLSKGVDLKDIILLDNSI